MASRKDSLCNLIKCGYTNTLSTSSSKVIHEEINCASNLSPSKYHENHLPLKIKPKLSPRIKQKEFPSFNSSSSSNGKSTPDLDQTIKINPAATALSIRGNDSLIHGELSSKPFKEMILPIHNKNSTSFNGKQIKGSLQRLNNKPHTRKENKKYCNNIEDEVTLHKNLADIFKQAKLSTRVKEKLIDDIPMKNMIHINPNSNNIMILNEVNNVKLKEIGKKIRRRRIDRNKGKISENPISEIDHI